MKRTVTKQPRRQQSGSRHVAPRRPGGPPAPQYGELDLPIEPAAPARWPSISACLIVKNEAENMRACLESLADLPAEIIVVDTGSTDDTVEIAQAMGAGVYHFPWIDDFAAARNESIRHARSAWIFWLDADDRLDDRAVAQLKRAAASGQADAYACLVESRGRGQERDTVGHVRLFRNGLGIQFQGAIHESVRHALVRLRLRLARTDITIQHLGYDTSAQAMAQKHKRNLNLIEQELARHPENIDLRFYRGEAHAGLGDLEMAQEDLLAYLAQSQPVPAPNFSYMRFWAYASLVQIAESQGQQQDTDSLLDRALAEYPDHPRYLFRRGRIHLERRQPELALTALQAAYQASQGVVQGHRVPEAWISASLAECHLALGDRTQAIAWAEQARTEDPGHQPAAALLARLYLDGNRMHDAAAVLEQIVPAADTSGPWLALTEFYARQGRWQEAHAALARAETFGLAESQAVEIRGRLEAGDVLVRTNSVAASIGAAQMQGMALFKKGDYTLAAERFAEAIEAAPTNPDNYKYLAVALDKLGQADAAAEAWQLAQHWRATAPTAAPAG